MERKVFYTPSGEKEIETYKKVYKEGEYKLIKTGKTNIYDKIQENKDTCDIRNIIERMTNGDLTAINTNKPVYGDATLQHKSLNEANQIIKTANANLNTLTDEEYKKVKEILGMKVETKTEEVNEAKEIVENKEGVKYE